jgi:hypothetical protein
LPLALDAVGEHAAQQALRILDRLAMGGMVEGFGAGWSLARLAI